MGQKIWQADEGIFFRCRVAAYNGSPSSTCESTSTATCFSCLFDEANGREFCEIMGPSYCKHCIKTSRQQKIDDDVTSALGISKNGGRSSFGDTFFHISSTFAFPSGRRLFKRLHNLNANSEYYINPQDGIGTALNSAQEISCETGSSQDRVDKKPAQTVNQGIQTLQVPGKERVTRTRKKQKDGRTGIMKRKFVTFNGLPIEPPLIAVGLSNQIMNNTHCELKYSTMY